MESQFGFEVRGGDQVPAAALLLREDEDEEDNDSELKVQKADAEPYDPTLAAGDIVAMKYRDAGVLGYVKSNTDAGHVTVIPLARRRDGAWVKRGQARGVGDVTKITKLPTTILNMCVRI